MAESILDFTSAEDRERALQIQQIKLTRGAIVAHLQDTIKRVEGGDTVGIILFEIDRELNSYPTWIFNHLIPPETIAGAIALGSHRITSMLAELSEDEVDEDDGV